MMCVPENTRLLPIRDGSTYHFEMSKRKVLVVFGTRPEAVKMAPVCHALAARPKQFETVICDTGQHREMTGQILSHSNVVPDVPLNIMRPNQTLFHVTSAVLQAFEEVLNRHKPDVVLVQGDTTSAMAAAISAFYVKCPVGHVEAGLRTHAKYSPFPEEMNRKLISQLGDYHFTPTAAATANLLAEGVSRHQIWQTGNTVVDALEYMLPRLRHLHPSETLRKIVPDRVGQEAVLITCHRRESFGDDLRNICKSIKQLARSHPEFDFVYPVHLNPNVQMTVKKELSYLPNVHLIPPQPYDTFLMLMDSAKFILTDSGGIQEEAYSLRKPILILRKRTERMEAVHAGYAWLVGCEGERIVGQVERLLADLAGGVDFFTMPNPFGDGKASERIVDTLDRFG